MARKGSLKKKPKNVAETTAEGQEGQKVSFEVGGKKGSRQENQADTPGHVLDLAFLVIVNAFWKGWQHQLTTVLVGGWGGVARTCPASLWCSYLPSIPNYSNGLGKWSTAKMLKGPRAFLICKAFFTSTL